MASAFASVLLAATLPALEDAVPPPSNRCLEAAVETFGRTAVTVAPGARGPRKLRHASPKYPVRELAFPTPWVGEVLISPQGSVRSVWTVRSLGENWPAPQCALALAAAIQKWRYKPTFMKGVAVPVCMTITVHFRLRPEGRSPHELGGQQRLVARH